MLTVRVTVTVTVTVRVTVTVTVTVTVASRDTVRVVLGKKMKTGPKPLTLVSSFH